MKKIAFLVGLMCVTLSVAAQSITGTSRIVLSHTGQSDKEVNFLLSASFSDAFDNTWDAVAANPGGIYVYAEAERYTTWASNAYSSNLAVGFGAYNDAGNLSYTLKFKNFTGTTTYKIYDRKTGKTIDVLGNDNIKIDGDAASQYDFTIDAGENNTTINSRFVINYVPGELDVCFRNDILDVNSNPFSTEDITIERVDGEDFPGTKVFAGTTALIDMSNDTNYPAGRYYVKFAGGDRKFVIVKE